MKYTIETTEKGCRETLEFIDDALGPMALTAEHIRTDNGSRCITNMIINQMRGLGYAEEIIDSAEDVLSSMRTLEFMRLGEYMNC